MGRGISSSISYGATGAPRSDDSLTNRAGQGAGTVAAAVGGYALFNAGGGATVLSGGTLTKAGAVAMVTGVTVVVGATANTVRLATTPMQMKKSGGYSKDDIDNMKKGKAPTGNDGHPKELHHPNQDPKAPVREMTRTDHRGKGNYTKNHPFGNQRPSRIDRQQFKKEREEFWKQRAREVEKKK